MAMLEQRIQQHFYESSDLFVQASEALARPVALAAAGLLTAITGGAKVLVCGWDASQCTAQRLASAFVGRFERERPPLAALALHPGPEPAAQLRALGQPGDVLLLASLADDDERLLALARQAREQDLTVIALTGRRADALAAALSEADVLIRVPHDRAARVHELHLVIVHCLCDAVDLQLLGEEHLA